MTPVTVIMKQSFLTLLFGTLSVSLLLGQSGKRALLIGVGNPPSFNTTPLNAAQGVRLVQTTLLNKGFQGENIRTCTDEAATRNGVLDALEQLRQETAPGDIVVLHFYGHGVQIPDDGADETDRLDEALVPFDGIRRPGNDFFNLIRDDVLGLSVQSLRERAGPAGQVLAVIDACHSGSGLRGAVAPQTGADTHRLSLTDNSGAVAPLIAFYAAMPHQAGIEMPQEGGARCALLTWNFCKALHRAAPTTTYRGLFEEIALLMAAKCRKQTPQAEGAIDMRVFGEPLPPPLPYFKVQMLLDDRTILLAGGLLQGLHPGDELALFPVETRDTTGKTPTAVAVVEEAGAGMLECRATLDRPLAGEAAQRAWVFVRNRRFLQYSLSLQIDIPNPDLQNEIRQYLSDINALNLDAGTASELTLSQEKGKWILWSADGYAVWEQDYHERRSAEVLTALRQALTAYLQAQFLRGLEFEGSPYTAEFTACVGAGANRVNVARSGLTARVIRDTVFLQVVNRGNAPVYYTILDIDARNRVKVLLPGESRLPADFRLEPGAASPLHAVRFDAPGREVLKLILTPQPVNLRDTVATRGRGWRGGSFFETLLADSFLENGPVRGASGKYDGNEAGVETVVLELVK